MGGIQIPHPEERVTWRASRRMAAGATSLVAVLRDARKRRAPLDEADEWCRYDSNLGNAVLGPGPAASARFGGREPEIPAGRCRRGNDRPGSAVRSR